MRGYLLREYTRIMRLYPGSWWGDRLDVRFELLKRMTKVAGGRTLDMGCAQGIVLHAAKGGERVGVDWDMGFLSGASRLSPNSCHVRADYHFLPFEAGVFDRALLGHIVGTEDLAVLLDEAHRALKPGGRVYITSPNPRYFQYRASTCPDLSLVVRELEKRGFSVEEAAGYNPIVFFFFGRGGGIISHVPGMDRVLALLMRLPWRWVRKICVAYLVVAKKG